MAARRIRVARNHIIVAVIGTLLVIAIAFSLWSSAREDEHAQWMVDLGHAQTFRRHIRVASNLMESGGFEQNQTAQAWALAEINHAWRSLIPLEYRYGLSQDVAHQREIFRIRASLENLGGCIGCIAGLNSTLRGSLSNLLNDMARKLVNAYGNFLNYTSADSIRGPSLWYFGPAPPDEGLLQQVVVLATNLEYYY